MVWLVLAVFPCTGGVYASPTRLLFLSVLKRANVCFYLNLAHEGLLVANAPLANSCSFDVSRECVKLLQGERCYDMTTGLFRVALRALFLAATDLC